jgi:hypothetical protein
MLLAEIDPIQIAIIVIAMGVGFVQWLWGLIKQTQEEKNRQNTSLSPEERAAREQAWRDQIEGQKQEQPAPRAPTSTPPPADPWGNVKDIFEKIKEEARKAQEQQNQPPSTRQQRPQPAQSMRQQPTPPALPRKTKAPEPVAAPPAPVVVARPQPQVASDMAAQGLSSRREQDPKGLLAFLQTPNALQQAVLLREVLGSPKALQSSQDSAF